MTAEPEKPDTFTGFFIRRPVAATVLSLFILLLGLQAFQQLQIRQFPKLVKTSILVSTHYPGADAATIQGFVTMPLQKALAGTEGVDYISSTSRSEFSRITVDLHFGVNVERAVADVLTKISQVSDILPDEANQPTVERSTGEWVALMYLEFNSEQLLPVQMVDYLNRSVVPALQAVQGVGHVDVMGSEPFAMRAWLDPERMAALGISATDVNDALRQNHFITAAGAVRTEALEISVTAATDLNSLEAFSELVVSSNGDRLVKLKDIADISLDQQQVETGFFSWTEPTVGVGVYPAPGANVLEVGDRVEQGMEAILSRLPSAISGRVMKDYTEPVRKSIAEVIQAIIEASVIVIGVVFLFLRNIRAVLIPVVTIPLSLVGVMSLVLLAGFSLNLFTLMAMVIAIGLVVDDAIVVVENIYRHMENGEPPLEAALNGAREIAWPVIAMTLTLAAVYTPIAFMSGLSGVLFREFALTLAGAVLISGVIALTLTPMMAARLLRREDMRGGQTPHTHAQQTVTRSEQAYLSLLNRCLNNSPVMLILGVGVLALTMLMLVSARRELTPPEDTSGLYVFAKGPASASLDYMITHYRALMDQIQRLPETTGNQFSSIARDASNEFGAGIELVDRADRTRGQSELIVEVQKLVDQNPALQGQSFSFSNIPGSGNGLPVQLVLQSTGDYQSLILVMEELVTRARTSGRFLFVDSDLRLNSPEYRIDIDRSKANALGIRMADIGETLSTLLGGNYTGHFGTQQRSYQVIPQAPRQFRSEREWLEGYRLRAANGRMVPLASVVTLSRRIQPNSLTTFQQLNSATLLAMPGIGQTLGDSIDYLQRVTSEILPAGYSVDYLGESRQYLQESNALMTTLLFSLLFIFLVLAAQFESWRDPLIILVAVPLSIFGAMLPITMGYTSLNIYTQVGLVTLIGLISKHGILIVEFANRLRQRHGMAAQEAIFQAARTRVRPIIMTTAAMALGVAPLLISTGEGAESRFAIGVVIAAGIVIGTCFTLLILPSAYLVLSDRDAKQPAV